MNTFIRQGKLPTCYGLVYVADLLWTCYGDTGVMDFAFNYTSLAPGGKIMHDTPTRPAIYAVIFFKQLMPT